MINSDTEISINKPVVSIIIINFNGGDYILDCIDSVFKTTGCKFEVLLIDNNSADNSSIICKEKYPEIKLFQCKENLAMAARNIGIDNAKGNFMVFLDADTVVEFNWLSILLNSYKKHGTGLYQGKLLKKDDHSIIESCGDMANVFGTGFARGRGTVDVGKYEEFQKITFPVGACTFAPSEVFRQIGHVDESKLFFLMLDDLDYGWRAWLLGIPSYYEPNAIIYHVGSPILKWSSKKFFYMERNRWICLFTLYSRKTLFQIFPLLLIYDFGIFLFLLSKGMAGAKIKSFFSFIRNYSKIQRRYHLMNNTRKLSDSEIIQNFVDEIDIPPTLAGKNTSRFFNIVLNSLSRRAKKIISHQ